MLATTAFSWENTRPQEAACFRRAGFGMVGALIAGSTLLAGAGVFAWGAVAPGAQLFGPTLHRAARKESVALTFDDGPNPAVTPRLLQLLEEHGVRATFFLIGRHVRACPDLAREIVARGHQVANHTDTHPNLLWLSAQRIREQLLRCYEAILQTTGQQAAWFRPPYGYRGPQLDSVVRALGFRGVVMWSQMPRDWKPQPLPRMLERLSRVSGGDMVVLHDGSPRGLNADRTVMLRGLDFWLPRWRERGLEFVTVDEIASPPAVKAPVQEPKREKETAAVA
jgi:peptidoglycan/xylan/chitin deacetylase (PgdA/CDA1 family)